MIERDIHRGTAEGNLPYTFVLSSRIMGRPVWREKHNIKLSVRREADGKYTVRFGKLRLATRFKCQTTAMRKGYEWHHDLTTPSLEEMVAGLVDNIKRSAALTMLRRLEESR